MIGRRLCTSTLAFSAAIAIGGVAVPAAAGPHNQVVASPTFEHRVLRPVQHGSTTIAHLHRANVPAPLLIPAFFQLQSFYGLGFPGFGPAGFVPGPGACTTHAPQTLGDLGYGGPTGYFAPVTTGADLPPTSADLAPTGQAPLTQSLLAQALSAFCATPGLDFSSLNFDD